MESVEKKSRSPFSTETDDFDCLKATGSPWPVAVDFPGLPARGGDLEDFYPDVCVKGLEKEPILKDTSSLETHP